MRPSTAALLAVALAFSPHVAGARGDPPGSPGEAHGSPAAPAGARGARGWHGRTTPEKAEAYAAYLAAALPKFRTIKGNLGYAMYREDGPSGSDFMVVSYWSSKDAIHAYAGEDISRTRPLPRDAEFLVNPEPTVHNYAIAAADPAP